MESDIKNVGISENKMLNDFNKALTDCGNLYNKNSLNIGNAFLDANGYEKTGSSTNQFLTPFIPIDKSKGESIFVRWANVGYQYDITMKPIAGTNITANNSVMEIHRDAAYIRIYFSGTNKENSQFISYGNELKSFLTNKAEKEIRTTSPYKVPANLKVYDKNLLEGGKYDIKLLNNGTITSWDNFFHSNYIPVSRGVCKNIKMTAYKGLNLFKVNNYAFYDESLAFINYIEVDYSQDSSARTIEAEIPEGAKYMTVDFMGVGTSYRDTAYFLVKYSCFNFGRGEEVSYSPGDGYNLVGDEEIVNTSVDLQGNIVGVGGSAKQSITPFIPVKPNTTYFCKVNGTSNYSVSSVAFYDAEKKIILSSPYTYNTLVTPPTCHYIILRKYLNGDNLKPYLIEAEKWQGVFGKEITGNEDLIVSTETDSVPNGGMKILGIYHQFIALLTYNNSILFSKDGWAGPYREIAIADLPGIDVATINSNSIRQVVFFKKSDGSATIFYRKEVSERWIGCLIFGNYNKLWCSVLAPDYDTSESYVVGNIVSKDGINYECTSNTSGTWVASNWKEVPNAFSYWDVPDVWDLKGQKHWRIDGSAAGNSITDANVVTRYKKYYPDMSDRANNFKFMWHQGPIWAEGDGQCARGLVWGNYADGVKVNNCNPCMFYTEDGKNIYVQYEFGIVSHYKKAGSDTVTNLYSYAPANFGDVVDVTSFSGSIGSMTIRKRYSIIPCEAEKDPVKIFDYDTNIINVNSFSGTTLTLAATGLAVGDVVVLEGNSTGDFAKLLTTNIDATTGIADGPVFYVKEVSGNNVVLCDTLGNTKNNLFCRHIHGISEFGSGYCIYTGEEYPLSWFIYILPKYESFANGVNMNDSVWTDYVLRLNASENAYQRSLGVYLRSDGKCVYIADTSKPLTAKMQIRGKDFVQNNCGLHVFDLQDIDDASKTITKIANLNVGYALYHIGSWLMFSDYYGKVFISKDYGDTWEFVCQNNETNQDFIGFDDNNRFFFNSKAGKQLVITKK